MSNELSHKPCPHIDCGSSDAFSYNVDKKCGKCHSCGRSYPTAGGAYFDWVAEEYPLPCVDIIKDSVSFRGVKNTVFDNLGVKTYRQVGGDVVRQEYTYPDLSKKIRLVPKDFRSEGSTSSQLWLSDKFPRGCAKKILVVEGELDACSAYQMLNTEKMTTILPVVSIPSATPSREFWPLAEKYLSGFEEIILCLDSDEPGEAMADRFNSIFTGKCKKLETGTYKDANEMLQAGQQQMFIQSYFNAAAFTPENVYHTEAELIALYEGQNDLTYASTGVKALDEVLLGLQKGFFTLFKASTGIGKTELMRFLEYQLLTQDKDCKIAVCHLEESKTRSILGLCSYELHKNVTRKDLIEAANLDTEVREAIAKIARTERYYQFTLPPSGSMDDLLTLFRMLAVGYGVDYIFIEPVQECISINNVDHREASLAELAVRLSQLSSELDIGIVSIAHTNDDGEIKYARMLGQRAAVVINVDRDMMHESETESNITRLTVTKNRPNTILGNAGEMFFDRETFTMREIGR